MDFIKSAHYRMANKKKKRTQIQVVVRIPWK